MAEKRPEFVFTVNRTQHSHAFVIGLCLLTGLKCGARRRFFFVRQQSPPRNHRRFYASHPACSYGTAHEWRCLTRPHRSPPSTGPSSVLQKVLSARGPNPRDERLALTKGLIDLTLRPEGARGMPIDQLPDAVLMVRMLDALISDVISSGVGQFLESSVMGAYARDVVRWCKAIGAKETARYVAEAIKRLPGGIIPADDDERRQLIDSLSDELLDGGPFDDLDDRFRDSLDDMTDRLRAYLTRKPEELDRWIALAVVPPIVATPKRITTAAASSTSPSISSVAATRAAGPPPLLANGDDPRVVAFMERLEVMTPSQWRDVGVRYGENIKALNNLRNDISIAIIVGRIAPVGRDKQKWRSANERARARAWDSFAKVSAQIPEKTKQRGKPFALHKAVVFAMNCALEAVIAIRELEVREGGDEELHTALLPFALA